MQCIQKLFSEGFEQRLHPGCVQYCMHPVSQRPPGYQISVCESKMSRVVGLWNFVGMCEFDPLDGMYGMLSMIRIAGIALNLLMLNLIG